MTRRHIMTAAHCFQKSIGHDCKMVNLDIVVKYGEIMIGGVCQTVNKTVKCTKKDVGEIIKIKRAQYENYFEAGCYGNDIAFLELEREIPKSLSHICLPHLHKVDDLDVWSEKYFAAGWGANPYKNLVTTQRLNKISLGKRLTNVECLEKVWKPSDTFCTLTTEERNVCTGDSGGGVIAKYEDKHYIFGLLSYGTICEEMIGKKQEYLRAEVHTDISYYTAEIDGFIGAKVENRESEWEEEIKKHPDALNMTNLKKPEFTKKMGPLTAQTIGFTNVILLLYYCVY